MQGITNVQHDISNKLDKSNVAGRAYIVDLSGNQDNREYSANPSNDSFVTRTNTGTVRGNNPAATNDLTTKSYVDGKVNGVKNWKTTYGFNGTGLNGNTNYASSSYLGGTMKSGDKYRVTMSDSRNGRCEVATFHIQLTYDACVLCLDMNVISSTPRIRQVRMVSNSTGGTFSFQTSTAVVSSVGNTDWHSDSNLRIKMIEREYVL